jgi:hypothetical protein
MPFDDQATGFSMGLNARGFHHSHIRHSASGTSAHHPIQARLQIDRMISGIAANLVQTLHGLAWRFHAWSSMPAMRAYLSSRLT